MESTWKAWTKNPGNKTFKVLPLLISWGIWLARNSGNFKEKATLPENLIAQSLAIIAHFPQTTPTKTSRPKFQEFIDTTKPWDYFDGAAQNSICGGGASLHLSENHFFHLKMGLGRGTNNYAELLSLKLLLLFAK